MPPVSVTMQALKFVVGAADVPGVLADVLGLEPHAPST